MHPKIQKKKFSENMHQILDVYKLKINDWLSCIRYLYRCISNYLSLNCFKIIRK